MKGGAKLVLPRTSRRAVGKLSGGSAKGEKMKRRKAKINRGASSFQKKKGGREKSIYTR